VAVETVAAVAVLVVADACGFLAGFFGDAGFAEVFVAGAFLIDC
jgi:hypothetical protein